MAEYTSFGEIIKNEVDGRDYLLKVSSIGSPVVILALHGGGIEPGTEEVAHEIHQTGEGLFVFSGIKRKGNNVLHVTSTLYDHPLALEIVKKSLFSISIHGFDGEEAITYLGGRCNKGISAIAEALDTAGFHVSVNPPSEIDGKDSKNIVNKNIRKKGVQVEISRGQRKTFFKEYGSRKGRQHRTKVFFRFTNALRCGMDWALENIMSEGKVSCE